MSNYGLPTKTQCVHIIHFAFQQWVKQDLFILKRVVTADNESDLLTKHLSRTLFYRHIDILTLLWVKKVLSSYVFIMSTFKDIMPCATKEKVF